MLDEYPLITTPALSANLPANLSSIGHALRKRGRPQKKTGPATVILDSDVEDVVEPPKRARLFLKPSRPPPSTDEIAMNVIEVSSKIVEPDTYEEAIGDPIHAAHWKEAIRIELETLHLNNTWELVDLPARRRAIGNKWVFRVKYDEYRRLIKYKARLVAQGYVQQHGIDYKETFSLTN